jgi:hypothetical protein
MESPGVPGLSELAVFEFVERSLLGSMLFFTLPSAPRGLDEWTFPVLRSSFDEWELPGSAKSLTGDFDAVFILPENLRSASTRFLFDLPYFNLTIRRPDFSVFWSTGSVFTVSQESEYEASNVADGLWLAELGRLPGTGRFGRLVPGSNWEGPLSEDLGF